EPDGRAAAHHGDIRLLRPQGIPAGGGRGDPQCDAALTSVEYGRVRGHRLPIKRGTRTVTATTRPARQRAYGRPNASRPWKRWPAQSIRCSWWAAAWSGP